MLSCHSIFLLQEQLQVETDRNGLQRLKYLSEGWNFWEWRGHKIQYIKAGTEALATAVPTPKDQIKHCLLNHHDIFTVPIENSGIE